MLAPMCLARRMSQWAVLFAFISALAAIACSWVLRNMQPNAVMRVVLAIIPVIPATLYVLFMVKATRTLDELQQRIQLEAVTFAFVASLVGSLTYGMLQKSGFLRAWAWDWEGIWAMLLGFWIVGMMISSRRYS